MRLLLTTICIVVIRANEGHISRSIVLHLDETTRTHVNTSNYDAITTEDGSTSRCVLNDNDTFQNSPKYDEIIDHDITNLTLGRTKLELIQSSDMEDEVDNVKVTTYNEAIEDFTCRLYLAESTIPHAGLGIFAGIPYSKQETLPFFGDIVIPLSPLEHTSLIHEYTWGGGDVPHSFCHGMYAIPNCFFPLKNVDVSPFYDYPEDDELWDNSSFNPGIGSSTIYYSKDGGSAIKDVKMGEEIFIDYSYDYFLSREGTKFDLMTLNEDYETADKMLHRFRNIVNSVSPKHGQCILSNQQSRDDKLSMMATSVDHSCWSKEEEESSSISNPNDSFVFDFYELTKAVITTWPTRVQGALPVEVQGINHMLDVAKSTALNYYGRSIRNITYLQQHGMCVDYIKSGKSTIPHAGKGAFANTFLPAGTVVAPMPLLHFLNRSHLNIYEGEMIDHSLDGIEDSDYNDDERDDEETQSGMKNRKVIHHQLLLNYCFGHNQSSILLCPYGVGSSLVNHAGPGYQANVKLVWSKAFTKRTEWLNQSIDDWSHSEYNGLAFEFIAMRDIKENEEILFDYGSNWEKAFYQQHASDSYLSSIHYMFHVINMYDDNPIDLPTYREKWKASDLKEILSSRSRSIDPSPTFNSFEIHVWCRATYLRFQMKHNLNNELEHYPCRIVAKDYVVHIETSGSVPNQVTEVLYTAEVYVRDHQVSELHEHLQDALCDDCFCSEDWVNVAFRLPRDAYIVGNVDSYDEMHPNPVADLAHYMKETWTFRHEMGIPDEIMPEKWKNSKHELD